MNLPVEYLPAQSVWMGLGLLMAAAIAAGAGRRRGVPLGEMLALFGICTVAGAVSSRLFWLLLDPAVDLGFFSDHLVLVVDPRSGGHSSFGALAGAAAVVALWWSLQREEWARCALDALVCGGLAGLALARIGCLANGCDFGRPTAMPWGVRFPAGSEAFASHVPRGLIAPDAAWSAAVHPFALYMALGTLAIVVTGVWAVWGQKLRPGRVALRASGAYFVWRFAAELTRDPSTVMNLAGSLNVHHLLAGVGLGLVLAVARWAGACEPTQPAPLSGRGQVEHPGQ